MIYSTNELAFMKAITVSELTQAVIDGSDEGFNVLVGSTPTHINTFPNYDDHPRILVHFDNGIPSSTAAGAFQILEHFFDFYTKSLDLDGTFSKDNQRAIAHQYFRECHALADIAAGNFLAALSLVRTRWASLPDSGNNQHENSVALLKQAYLDAGGMIA